MVTRIPQTLQVPVVFSPSARDSIPGAAVLVRVLETLQVPLPRSPSARDSIPGAAVVTRVPQALQLPVVRSLSARVSIPRAAVLVRVPQTLQVPLRRSFDARVGAPGAAVLLAHVSQTLQVPAARSSTANDPLFHPARQSRVLHRAPACPRRECEEPAFQEVKFGEYDLFQNVWGQGPEERTEPVVAHRGVPIFDRVGGVDRVLVDGVRHFRAAREGVRWGAPLEGRLFLGPAVST